MNTVNKVILIGNVGQAPQIKTVGKSNKVANISIATTERGYTTKDGKTVEDETIWHNISAWGGLATIVENHVNKGDRLYIEGSLAPNEYVKSNGEKVYGYTVKADVIKFQNGKKKPEAGNTGTSEATIEEDLPF